jgi:hypothetical protein
MMEGELNEISESAEKRSEESINDQVMGLWIVGQVVGMGKVAGEMSYYFLTSCHRMLYDCDYDYDYGYQPTLSICPALELVAMAMGLWVEKSDYMADFEVGKIR